MRRTDEAWLNTLADMERFADSGDALSRLVRDTVQGGASDELNDDELWLVAAARKAPPLRFGTEKNG